MHYSINHAWILKLNKHLYSHFASRLGPNSAKHGNKVDQKWENTYVEYYKYGTMKSWLGGCLFVLRFTKTSIIFKYAPTTTIWQKGTQSFGLLLIITVMFEIKKALPVFLTTKPINFCLSHGWQWNMTVSNTTPCRCSMLLVTC